MEEKIMKHVFRELLIAFLVLLIVGACSQPFAPTNLDSTAAASAQTGLNDQRVSGINLTPTIVAALTTAADQYVTLTFTNAHIDKSTLSAIKFWTLKSTAASDGGRDHLANITPSSPTVRYQGNNTVVIYKLDLSNAAQISNRIELTIDPTVLTANNGTVKLNRDGDDYVGEANEDEYVTELAVGGSPGINAGGAARNPQATLAVAIGGWALGSTAITGTFAGSPTIDKAVLDAAFTVQKFNRTTLAWDKVTPSSTTYAGGVYTFNLPAAIANGEVYRIIANEYAVVETNPTNGYRRRLNFDNNATKNIDLGPTAFGADASYNTTATYAFTVTFDGRNRNGYIDVTVAGIGTEGLDPATITTDNVKIYDTADNKFVGIDSIEVFASIPGTTKNDKIRIHLPASYTRQVHAYALFVGPNAKELGNTTATTDDKSLGDWTNVTIYPLLFNAIVGTGQI